jgi:hypothetical protein
MSRVFALLIGAEKYEPQSELPQLTGTIQHIKDFYDWLVQVRNAAADDVFVCSSPPIEEYGGRRASRDDIRMAAAALVDRGQSKGGDVFILLSGHGFRSTKADAVEDVFIGADYAPGDGGKCFRLVELRAYLAKGMGPGTHFWFVDSCRLSLDIKPGDLSPVARNASIGEPVRHSLYSAAPGQAAWSDSHFTTALKSGLHGEGRAKEWIEGHYWVTAPRVVKTVEAAVQVQGIEVDFELGEPVGRILMIDPEPTPVNVTIEVGGADQGDRFRLLLSGGDRQLQMFRFTWPANRLAVPPGEYQVNLEFEEDLFRSVHPPAGTKADMYEPTTVVFDKTSPAEKAIPATVRVDDPPSSNLNTRIDGRMADTNQGVQITPGEHVRVELMDLDEPVGGRTVSVAGPPPLHLSLGDLILPRPLRRSLLDYVGHSDGLDAGLHFSDFFEQRGPDSGVADTDPSTLLTLMGTAAICDMKPYRPLIRPFKTFDDLGKGNSGIYILVSGGLGTATVHSDQMQAELGEVPGIPEITHASFVVMPGHHRVRITLPGITDTVMTTVALANRVTLLVVSTGNGATQLFQFALPVGHLHDLRSRAGGLPLADFGLPRAARFGALVQRRFGEGRPVLDGNPHPTHASLWRELTSGHWHDPLTVLVTAYELIRQGASAQTDHRRTELEHLTRLIADEARYGAPDDAAVLQSLLVGERPHTTDAPLVLDGLLAANAGTGDIPDQMVLSYQGPWTRWRAWTPPPPQVRTAVQGGAVLRRNPGVDVEASEQRIRPSGHSKDPTPNRPLDSGARVARRGWISVNQDSSSSGKFISYAGMRRFVGWLGFSLPFVLPAGYVIFFPRHGFPGSISGYYYTGMRNYLVAALCVLGVLFIAYDAYHDKLDFWITNLAGIFAVAVAFFPTEPAAASAHQKDIGHIHFVFAALLFTMLAVMALRFTKTNPDGDPTSQKSRRNIIYITCAALIAASMLVAFIANFLPAAIKQSMPSLFWFEAIAVVAFSVSWLVKGGTFPVLNDKRPVAVLASAGAENSSARQIETA